jgi:hypothetical protein
MRRDILIVALGVLTAQTLRPATADVSSVPEPDLVWSGELRERFEANDAAGFGLSDSGNDDYFLHRVRLAADWRSSGNIRVFGEAISGSTSGWSAEPAAVQSNGLDLLQGFVDVSGKVAGGRLVARAGRQEISLGASRLVSIRESANVRRAFDGVRVIWTSAVGTRVDAFVTQPVVPEPGAWDDRGTPGQRLWGVDATLAPRPLGGIKLETYYLGWKRNAARFRGITARELRHSVGSRLFGQVGPADWNVEAAFQWGRFGSERIRAWTTSLDVGYALGNLPLSPRLGLKADVISGDRNPRDGRLQTFNPLFPRLPYFSEANLATPANLVDIQPNLTLQVSRSVTATLSWNNLWKFARQDAFYVPPLTARSGTAPTYSLYVGQQYGIALAWQAARTLQVGATVVRFHPGAVVREAGGRSGKFVAAWVQYHFSSD